MCYLVDVRYNHIIIISNYGGNGYFHYINKFKKNLSKGNGGSGGNIYFWFSSKKSNNVNIFKKYSNNKFFGKNGSKKGDGGHGLCSYIRIPWNFFSYIVNVPLKGYGNYIYNLQGSKGGSPIRKSNNYTNSKKVHILKIKYLNFIKKSNNITILNKCFRFINTLYNNKSFFIINFKLIKINLNCYSKKIIAVAIILYKSYLCRINFFLFKKKFFVVS